MDLTYNNIHRLSIKKPTHWTNNSTPNVTSLVGISPSSMTPQITTLNGSHEGNIKGKLMSHANCGEFLT
jgi:hypothetical protein